MPAATAELAVGLLGEVAEHVVRGLGVGEQVVVDRGRDDVHAGQSGSRRTPSAAARRSPARRAGWHPRSAHPSPGRGRRRTAGRATTVRRGRPGGPGRPGPSARRRRGGPRRPARPGRHLARVERARERGGVERSARRWPACRSRPPDEVPEQERQLPLVLLVAPGRAAGDAPAHRRAAPASATAWCAGAGPGATRRAAPRPARTSASGCRGRTRARGRSASSAASRRSAWPR